MSEETPLSLTPPTAKPTPQQAKSLALVRELTDSAATLVIKVATCKCDKKDTCKVYLHGQRMADIIDKLQDIRESEVVGPAVISTGEKGKRAKSRRNV
jgi:hypothetical protein